MCVSPITIDNPYFGRGRRFAGSYLHNCTLSRITVPCGQCPQCIAMRQSFYLQRVQMESLRSHLFFFTLTYNDESLPWLDVGEYQLPYPDITDIQKVFHRLRKQGYKFRVSYVTEYGKRRHRPHFHGILAVDKSIGDFRTIEKIYKQLFWNEWKRNYAPSVWSPKKQKYIINRRASVWRPLFTPKYEKGRCTTFDLHYIEPVMDHDNDVAFYVSKYITKYDSWIKGLLSKIKLDENLDPDESVYLIDKLKPRCVTSKDFGDWKFPPIQAYINKCSLRESLYTYPQYYDIYTGKQMPMAPYYGKHLVNFAHLYNRFENSDLRDEESTFFFRNDTILDTRISCDSNLKLVQEYQKKLKKLNDRLRE